MCGPFFLIRTCDSWVKIFLHVVLFKDLFTLFHRGALVFYLFLLPFSVSCWVDCKVNFTTTSGKFFLFIPSVCCWVVLALFKLVLFQRRGWRGVPCMAGCKHINTGARPSLHMWAECNMHNRVWCFRNFTVILFFARITANKTQINHQVVNVLAARGRKSKLTHENKLVISFIKPVLTCGAQL